MNFATVTSKGQTTIPKDVRAAANLKAGDRIHFTVLADGTILVRVKNRSIRDIAIKPPGGRRVSGPDPANRHCYSKSTMAAAPGLLPGRG